MERKMDLKEFENRIQNLFEINPVVAILRPRQCGKTTLTRHFNFNRHKHPPLNFLNMDFLQRYIIDIYVANCRGMLNNSASPSNEEAL
jgi:predicted AAA+ superfamily ATPase